MSRMKREHVSIFPGVPLLPPVTPKPNARDADGNNDVTGHNEVTGQMNGQLVNRFPFGILLPTSSPEHASPTPRKMIKLQNGPVGPLSDSPGKMSCPVCNKWFHSRQQVAQHMLVHTDVRKYNCRYCDRAFKQPSHLDQHHRIHTGEKPYKCTMPGCARAFPQLSNLNHHLKNHDKPDPPAQNTCTICDRTYASETVLKTHIQTIHKNETTTRIKCKQSAIEGLRALAKGRQLQSQSRFDPANLPVFPSTIHRQPLLTHLIKEATTPPEMTALENKPDNLKHGVIQRDHDVTQHCHDVTQSNHDVIQSDIKPLLVNNPVTKAVHDANVSSGTEQIGNQNVTTTSIPLTFPGQNYLNNIDSLNVLSNTKQITCASQISYSPAQPFQPLSGPVSVTLNNGSNNKLSVINTLQSDPRMRLVTEMQQLPILSTPFPVGPIMVNRSLNNSLPVLSSPVSKLHGQRMICQPPMTINYPVPNLISVNGVSNTGMIPTNPLPLANQITDVQSKPNTIQNKPKSGRIEYVPMDIVINVPVLRHNDDNDTDNEMKNPPITSMAPPLLLGPHAQLPAPPHMLGNILGQAIDQILPQEMPWLSTGKPPQNVQMSDGESSGETWPGGVRPSHSVQIDDKRGDQRQEDLDINSHHENNYQYVLEPADDMDKQQVKPSENDNTIHENNVNDLDNNEAGSKCTAFSREFQTVVNVFNIMDNVSSNHETQISRKPLQQGTGPNHQMDLNQCVSSVSRRSSENFANMDEDFVNIETKTFGDAKNDVNGEFDVNKNVFTESSSSDNLTARSRARKRKASVPHRFIREDD